MTTAFTESRSPRLPDNHPIHVERVLAREQAWKKERKRNRFWRAIISATCLAILILIAIVALT